MGVNNEWTYLLESYLEIAQDQTKKYDEYKRLQKDGKTPEEILAALHADIEVREKSLADLRIKISNKRKELEEETK